MDTQQKQAGSSQERDFGALDELAVHKFVDRNAPPNLPRGTARAKAMAQVIRTGFPDFRWRFRALLGRPIVLPTYAAPTRAHFLYSAVYSERRPVD
jgi:hypothetical protein